MELVRHGRRVSQAPPSKPHREAPMHRRHSRPPFLLLLTITALALVRCEPHNGFSAPDGDTDGDVARPQRVAGAQPRLEIDGIALLSG
jgi:hypothetical protein